MKRHLRQILAFACGFGALSTCIAQDSRPAAPAASLEFVQSEPKPLRSLVRKRGAATGPDSERFRIAAVIETRPALAKSTAEKDSERIIVKALGGVVGWKNPEKAPNRRVRADVKSGEASVEHETVRSENAPDEAIADRWTVTAVDEPTAKAVVNALMASYEDYISQTVSRVQRTRKNYRTEAEKLHQSATDIEKKIPDAEEESRKLGVDQMSTQSIDDALGRLDQEGRLNDIDIAGLQASLASAGSRLAATRAKNADIEPGTREEISRALHRLQVELEIQLVGKLARKEALAQEREQLRKGRETRAELEELRGQLAKIRQDLQTHEEKLIPGEDQNLAKAEQLRGANEIQQVLMIPILPAGR